jgi:hypothetical protein
MGMYNSPLMVWCEEQDEQHYLKPPEWYYEHYRKLPPTFTWTLIKKDWEFRSLHGLNVVASTEGIQGTGKSLGNLYMAIVCADIFGIPYEIENTYIDRALLNQKVREAKTRTTFILDEQKHKNVGVMSKTTELDLIDWEEQSRATQKNLFYCSRYVQNHAHYYAFKAMRVNRLKNERCFHCMKEAECKARGLYKPTMCKDIPYWKRGGYPVSFSFEFYTPRPHDDELVLRGIVELLMVAPETAKMYNKIKTKNLAALEANEQHGWKILKESAHKIAEKHKDELIKERVVGKKTFYSCATKYAIKALIYDEFDIGKFPNEAIELIITVIKQKTEENIALKQQGINI